MKIQRDKNDMAQNPLYAPTPPSQLEQEKQSNDRPERLDDDARSTTDTAATNNMQILTDKTSGKRYSYNNATGESKWLTPADGDLVSGAEAAPPANSNETSNKSKRRSFIKVTNDEIGEGDYFQDTETGKTVWEIPADGDLVSIGADASPANNETSNKSKRRSFIKVTNDEIGAGDYFQDTETGKTVWEIPVDGDLVAN